MDTGIIVWILAVLLGILGIVAIARKDAKVMGISKWLLASFLIIPAVFLILLQAGLLVSISSSLAPLSAAGTKVIVQGGQQTGTGGQTLVVGETYQPTASYASKDVFATTSVSGTSYYKVGSDPATTTAKTNVKSGQQYTYWVSNTSTYYCAPKVFTANAGANDIVGDCWANSSATITAYDTVNHQTMDSGAYNTTLGANGQANVDITYQGTAKNSAGPFGGVFIVEKNSTISSVLCTGDQLTTTNPYHLTYTTSSTNRDFKTWAYTSEMDDGSGKVRTISCQFKNGATAISAASAWIVKFIPANYYVTNAGEIVLDTEKYANDDNTRTALGWPTDTYYFT